MVRQSALPTGLNSLVARYMYGTAHAELKRESACKLARSEHSTRGEGESTSTRAFEGARAKVVTQLQ